MVSEVPGVVFTERVFMAVGLQQPRKHSKAKPTLLCAAGRHSYAVWGLHSPVYRQVCFSESSIKISLIINMLSSLV